MVPKLGDHHVVQRVGGAQTELQLPAGVAEAEGAVQRRVERGLERAGNGVAAGIAELARRQAW